MLCKNTISVYNIVTHFQLEGIQNQIFSLNANSVFKSRIQKVYKVYGQNDDNMVTISSSYLQS